MTGPIPIQQVQIQPQLAPRQLTLGEQVAPILEQITQQKIASAQLENYKGLAAQRRDEAAARARDLQDQADGAKAFYDQLSGAATILRPEPPSKDGMPSHQGIDKNNGTLMPLGQFLRGLSPGAAAAYQKHLQDFNATVLQSHQATESQVRTQHEVALTDVARQQAEAAVRAIADDKRRHEILATSNLTTDSGQLRAVRRILQEVGPEAAGPVAITLNTGTGHDKLIAPDGTLWVGHNGVWHRDVNIGAKASQVLVDATKRNAAQARDLIDEQSKLIRDLGIGSSKNPTLAAVAEASRVLGVSTEGLSNWLRNDPEQLTRMLRTRFSHLYVGLLPHSRSSQQLLENLSESYWAPAGSGKQLLTRAERDRRELRRILDDLASGRTTNWARLPGWSEAASAAAAEGAQVPQGAGIGTTAQPNPDEWAQGVPPQ